MSLRTPTIDHRRPRADAMMNTPLTDLEIEIVQAGQIGGGLRGRWIIRRCTHRNDADEGGGE
jgi:hypothetical protein